MAALQKHQSKGKGTGRLGKGETHHLPSLLCQEGMVGPPSAWICASSAEGGRALCCGCGALPQAGWEGGVCAGSQP